MRTNAETKEQLIEVTISPRAANVYSFVTFFVANIIFGTCFSMLWGVEFFILGWKQFLTNYILVLMSIIGGMIFHEALHALTWACFASKPLQSITAGINRKQLAPYVHINEFLTKKAYTFGVMMPGALLGLVPCMFAVVYNVGWLLCLGIFLTAGSAGDFYSIIKLNPFPSSCMVLDHSEHLGFIVKTAARK